MNTASWSILPRERNLSRVYDPISGWQKLVLVERDSTPDTWTITGPPRALHPFTVGGGCILNRNEKQITSGKITNITRGGSVDAEGRSVESMTVSFASDLMPLGHRVVVPSPSFAMTPSIFHFPAAYDLRTGTVEDLIIGYTRSNLGDLAVADRRLARLRFPTSLGRGGTTQVSGRFDNLGVLTKSLAEAGNLRQRVVHTEDAAGAWLDLVIDAVADLSADIRFGTADSTAAGLITDWAYEIGMPTTTRAVVAGGGELAARDMLQLKATEPEALWGAVVELLVDQRHVAPESTDKLAELTRGGQEALDEGAGPVKVSFTPMFGPDLEYRRDVRVGDIVGYDLPGLDPAKDKIREATTVVVVQDGEPTEQVAVVVGTPDAPSTRTQRQTVRALRTVNILQRS